MKRFKNILYVLDGTMLSHLNSAERVAKLARQNEANYNGPQCQDSFLLNLSVKFR
jgi:hypothetical protein